MKRICALVVVLAAFGVSLFVVEGCRKKTVAVESGKIVSAERTSFKEVTSKLDTGGDFYLYLSTEQWLENLSGKISGWHELAGAVPEFQDHRDVVDTAFGVVARVVKDSGLENVSGVGMSSIAREPGLYHSKMVVHHYPGEGNGFIWTLFGKEPHELTGLDLLPTDTAMAAFYDLDVAQG